MTTQSSHESSSASTGASRSPYLAEPSRRVIRLAKMLAETIKEIKLTDVRTRLDGERIRGMNLCKEYLESFMCDLLRVRTSDKYVVYALNKHKLYVSAKPICPHGEHYKAIISESDIEVDEIDFAFLPCSGITSHADILRVALLFEG